MVIVCFACGCAPLQATGDEEQIACLHCGETRVATVLARAPRFAGHVRGPCARYEDLPARPVTLRTTP